MSLPPSAAAVKGLHSIDALSATAAKQLWALQHGTTVPDWLQQLTSAATPHPAELPPILVAAFSIHAYAHIARQALHFAPELQQLLCLQAADGSTLLHHALAAAVAPQQDDRRAALQLRALSHQLQTLLYIGAPLGATNSKGQTATKQARLAIQRRRADHPAQAQQAAQYLSHVEALLAMLERLQGAGNGLRFFIKKGRHTKERRAVVCVLLMRHVM